jgi:hypothetical protein
MSHPIYEPFRQRAIRKQKAKALAIKTAKFLGGAAIGFCLLAMYHNAFAFTTSSYLICPLNMEFE